MGMLALAASDLALIYLKQFRVERSRFATHRLQHEKGKLPNARNYQSWLFRLIPIALPQPADADYPDMDRLAQVSF